MELIGLYHISFSVSTVGRSRGIWRTTGCHSLWCNLAQYSKIQTPCSKTLENKLLFKTLLNSNLSPNHHVNERMQST